MDVTSLEDVDYLLGLLQKDLRHWKMSRVQLLSARLHIAINSLENQQPLFWQLESSDFQGLLSKEKNRWIAAIFQEYRVETIAFAVHMVKFDRDK